MTLRVAPGLDEIALETRTTVALGGNPASGLGVNDRRGVLLGTPTRDGCC